MSPTPTPTANTEQAGQAADTTAHTACCAISRLKMKTNYYNRRQVRHNGWGFQVRQKREKFGRGKPGTHSLGKKDPGVIEPNPLRRI